MKYFTGLIFSFLVILFVFQLQWLNISWHQAINNDFNINFNSAEVALARAELLGYIKDANGLSAELYSDAEISHINDIKIVVSRVRLWLLVILALLLVILILLLLQKGITNIFTWIRQTAWQLALLWAVVLVITKTLFGTVFTQMHYILFSQGNWYFDPTKDLIIRLYSPDFFSYFIILWFTTAIIIMLLTPLIIYVLISEAE